MSTYLDLDLLRTFVMIAETGALSRAADRVGRTQAAISMQVKRLEDIVSQPLLVRTGRGVLLTPHGERLLVHARKILRAHDEAMAELSGRGLSGIIRLGCPDDYATVFLPPLLRDFASRHPQVLVEVYCAPTPRLLERMDSHALDIAIISLDEASARNAPDGPPGTGLDDGISSIINAWPRPEHASPHSAAQCAAPSAGSVR